MNEQEKKDHYNAIKQIQLKIRFYYNFLNLLNGSKMDTSLYDIDLKSNKFMELSESEIEAFFVHNIPEKIKDVNMGNTKITSPFVSERAKQIVINTLVKSYNNYIQNPVSANEEEI